MSRREQTSKPPTFSTFFLLIPPSFSMLFSSPNPISYDNFKENIYFLLYSQLQHRPSLFKVVFKVCSCTDNIQCLLQSSVRRYSYGYDIVEKNLIENEFLQWFSTKHCRQLLVKLFVYCVFSDKIITSLADKQSDCIANDYGIR